MLTSLRIQNFRSIRDASVKLGQVNLFIGPNNSGKSNFLKGITLFGAYLSAFPRGYKLTPDQFQLLLPRELSQQKRKTEIIRLVAEMSDDDKQAVSLIIGHAYDYDRYEEEGKFVSDITTTKSVNDSHNFNDFFEQEGYPGEEYVPSLIWKAQAHFINTKLYKFEPAAFMFSEKVSNQPFLDANGKNITPFLFTLSQTHEDAFIRLRSDLAKCVGTLTSVSTPPDPINPGNLRLRFTDKMRAFWAEEVSEGVLYFLAILCIIHQPDPPKLLLLEEPEKGIHPRRIREVMDFIFELAELRDIQIILTSHSPYVVDYFKDIPECISIFDRDPETGETLIKNAGDYIEQSNEELVKKGFEPISYTNSLGEYWVSGFLGGVPLSNL